MTSRAGYAVGVSDYLQEAFTHGAQGWQVLDQLAAAAQGSIVTRKAIAPSEAEAAANPRSRSAKLRVFQKAGGQEGLDSSSSSGSSGRRQRASRKLAQSDVAEGAAAGSPVGS
jgi:hypothetical protein